MRRFAYTLAVVFMLLSGASCSLFGFKWGGSVVAVVGDEDITFDMVAVRAQALRKNPRAAANPQATAFVQLVQGHLSAQIVNRYGDWVSDASVKAYWAAQQPVLPDAVREVTAAAGEELILRALAKPDFGTWLLDSLFHGRPELQQAESELAMRLHAQLLADPAAFDAIAAREGLEVDRLWIGPQSIRSTAREAAGAATGPTYTKDEIRQAGDYYLAFGSLRAGEIYPQPLSTPDAFQIFKLEQRKDGELLVAVMTIAKLSLDDWFTSQAASIPVELRDRELGRLLLSAAPWARRLKIVNQDDYPEFFMPSGE